MPWLLATSSIAVALTVTSGAGQPRNPTHDVERLPDRQLEPVALRRRRQLPDQRQAFLEMANRLLERHSSGGQFARLAPQRDGRGWISGLGVVVGEQFRLVGRPDRRSRFSSTCAIWACSGRRFLLSSES